MERVKHRSPVEAKGDDPCMTLSWSGGSAGSGTKKVRAWFASLDERSGKAVIADGIPRECPETDAPASCAGEQRERPHCLRYTGAAVRRG